MHTPDGKRIELIPGHIYHSVIHHLGRIREAVWIYRGESHRSPRYTGTYRSYWWVDLERVADNRTKKVIHADSGIKKWMLQRGTVEEVQVSDLPIYIGMTTKYPAWDRFFGKEVPDGNEITAGV